MTNDGALVGTRFKGYLWHKHENRLYAHRDSGKHHPMSFVKPSWRTNFQGGYHITVNGEKKFISQMSLLADHNSFH